MKGIRWHHGGDGGDLIILSVVLINFFRVLNISTVKKKIVKFFQNMLNLLNLSK